MANYSPLFINAVGGHEQLTPAHGGLVIDVVDCTAAGSAVQLFNTVTVAGSVSILTGYNAVVAIGASGGVFNFAGAMHIAEGLNVHGTAVFEDSVVLGNASTDTITFTGRIAGDIAFVPSVAHILALDQANLTVRTTTTGHIIITAASSLSLGGTTGASLYNNTGPVVVQAATTASLSAGLGSDLILGARGGTVTLNQIGNTTLNLATTPPFFTATSVIGALNELRACVTDTVASTASGGAITKGDLVCLDWDAGHTRVEVYQCDNTSVTRNRPVGVALADAIAGTACYYATCGIVTIKTSFAVPPGTHNEGDYLYMTTAGNVSLTPPVTNTIMVVGVLLNVGSGVGTATMIYQPLLPAYIAT